MQLLKHLFADCIPFIMLCAKNVLKKCVTFNDTLCACLKEFRYRLFLVVLLCCTLLTT